MSDTEHDRFGCNLVVKDGPMPVARFRFKKDMALFLHAFIDSKIDDRRARELNISISGREGEVGQ
jgi:hypothetical protein